MLPALAGLTAHFAILSGPITKGSSVSMQPGEVGPHNGPTMAQESFCFIIRRDDLRAILEKLQEA